MSVYLVTTKNVIVIKQHCAQLQFCCDNLIQLKIPVSGIPDTLAQDVLVEAASEVALQQPVIIDCLGHHTTHKLKVAQVVVVTVGRGVDGIRDPVTR